MIDRRRFISTSCASLHAKLLPAGKANSQIAGYAFVISGFPAGGIGEI